MNGLTGRRYTEQEELVDELLHLDRLRVEALDPTAVQNGSRSWSLPPRLIELGQPGIREEGLPFDNTLLNPADFIELLGI